MQLVHSWAAGAAGCQREGQASRVGSCGRGWGAGVSAADSAPQLSPSWLRASTAKFGDSRAGAGARVQGFESE